MTAEKRKALATLKALDIPLGATFDGLHMDRVRGLVEEAARLRYRKPRSTTDSRARSFHKHLQRTARKTATR